MAAGQAAEANQALFEHRILAVHFFVASSIADAISGDARRFP
jgi:hypothetical protein